MNAAQMHAGLNPSPSPHPSEPLRRRLSALPASIKGVIVRAEREQGPYGPTQIAGQSLQVLDAVNLAQAAFPWGFTMPVSVARKIEFIARDMGLDIQVRPVVLTHDQCVEYRLPRTPIKDSANGKGKFEERFGEGATELDALEALHPGLLEQILEEEILRYYDDDLGDEVERAADDFQAELDLAEEDIGERHEAEREAIQADYDRLAGELNAEIAVLRERYGPRFAEIAERFNAHQNTITEALRDEAPDVDQIDWPEPREGDEDDDPLFDSTRDYVEQIDRYKEHQDKPTEGLL
jgi:hypothetical protein